MVLVHLPNILTSHFLQGCLGTPWNIIDYIYPPPSPSHSPHLCLCPLQVARVVAFSGAIVAARKNMRKAQAALADKGERVSVGERLHV